LLALRGELALGTARTLEYDPDICVVHHGLRTGGKGGADFALGVIGCPDGSGPGPCPAGGCECGILCGNGLRVGTDVSLTFDAG
jgi:hypothetical protein